MRRSLLVLALMAAAQSGSAAERGDFGAGVIIGSPVAATAKYYLSKTHAVDLGIGGIGGSLAVYGDALWHLWEAEPPPKSGHLSAYLGVGGRFRNAREDVLVGVRAPAGVSYRLGGHPVEIFAEIAPVFEVAPRHFIQLDGGIGARFYFAGAK